jgi:hypothetical protein
MRVNAMAITLQAHSWHVETLKIFDARNASKSFDPFPTSIIAIVRCHPERSIFSSGCSDRRPFIRWARASALFTISISYFGIDVSQKL